GNFLAAVIFTILGLLTIKFFNISYPMTIVSTTQSSELAVVGEGKVEVTPDTAYIDAGITIDKASSVGEAQKKINEINNKIINALREIGIEKADIKTSNYSINPNYKYENNENRVDGYNGSVTIEIKVRDPQLASKVIETVTTAGANQINGSRFVVNKPELYREEARNAAIKNAKDQAQKIAKDLGIKLGKITNIVETSPGQTTLPIYAKLSADSLGGGGGPTIEQGSQTITSVVTLYFEKK
ncbi:MAG: SIMPL domain-containing protein, partial [Patescibacteria group bacterium]